jgi:hypothetical protein
MEEFNESELIDYDNAENIKSDKYLQLISFDNNRIEVNKLSLDLLRSIEEDLIIVSILGKEKSGKSYLLNLLYDESSKGVY